MRVRGRARRHLRQSRLHPSRERTSQVERQGCVPEAKRKRVRGRVQKRQVRRLRCLPLFQRRLVRGRVKARPQVTHLHTPTRSYTHTYTRLHPHLHTPTPTVCMHNILWPDALSVTISPSLSHSVSLSLTLSLSRSLSLSLSLSLPLSLSLVRHLAIAIGTEAHIMYTEAHARTVQVRGRVEARPQVRQGHHIVAHGPLV